MESKTIYKDRLVKDRTRELGKMTTTAETQNSKDDIAGLFAEVKQTIQNNVIPTINDGVNAISNLITEVTKWGNRFLGLLVLAIIRIIKNL